MPEDRDAFRERLLAQGRSALEADAKREVRQKAEQREQLYGEGIEAARTLFRRLTGVETEPDEWKDAYDTEEKGGDLTYYVFWHYYGSCRS